VDVCVGAHGAAGAAGERGAGVAPNCGAAAPIVTHHGGTIYGQQHFSHMSPSPSSFKSRRSDLTGGPAFVKLAKRNRACRVFAASALKRVSRQYYCARCISLRDCISPPLQRAIPNLGGSSPPVRHLSFVPLKWGSDAVISGRHAVHPLETIENFGAVTYGVQAICRAGI
jgi:hypothetical protein